MILVAAMAAATVISVAFGGDDSPDRGVVVEWLRGGDTPEPDSMPTATRASGSEPAATATEAGTETPGAPAVTGFSYPVAGGCLPEIDELMPNAPRPYRNGIHEGVDFYDFDNCATIGRGSEVLAAKAGRVVRADWDYQPLTPEELADLEQRVAEGNANDQEVEDVYRGRQVWIDHGGGVITRYAHLEGIAEGIDVGATVEQGQLVAYIGDSGTPESITAPGTEIHLHFELRAGASYLGAGLPPEETRALYEEAFSGP